MTDMLPDSDAQDELDDGLRELLADRALGSPGAGLEARESAIKIDPVADIVQAVEDGRATDAHLEDRRLAVGLSGVRGCEMCGQIYPRHRLPNHAPSWNTLPGISCPRKKPSSPIFW